MLAPSLLTLATTCKAIYNKCVGIFCARNEFEVHSLGAFQISFDAVHETNTAALRTLSIYPICCSMATIVESLQASRQKLLR